LRVVPSERQRYELYLPPESLDQVNHWAAASAVKARTKEKVWRSCVSPGVVFSPLIDLFPKLQCLLRPVKGKKKKKKRVKRSRTRWK
jgi:hypothetical protein